MEKRTSSASEQASEWVNLQASVSYPDGDTDSIHASIHPGGDSVTVNYRGGDPLVIESAHIGAFIELLQRTRDSL
ncbi:hypothetical protein [Crystallibacter degradans]|uniref:hypothetical protein n=1 Tax=Crystallibacter degradans TaxID=2726743 RepID=UPI001475DA31|nr:hypothetical protein [Arthrobacter sp. SF27]NMR29955.1 hypothetical protein [Arthrobacter sp. SF27]